MSRLSRLPALAILVLLSTLSSISLAADQQTTWGAGVSLEAYENGHLDVAEATLGLMQRFGPALGFSGDILYEAGAGTSLEAARFHYRQENKPYNVILGLSYLPFGNFTSAMVSKPLTLELGETSGPLMVLGYSAGQQDLGLYLFNGGLQVSGNPLAYGLQLRRQTSAGLLGLGYISDIGDSKNLQATIVGNLGSGNVAAHVPGMNLYYVHEGTRHQWVLEYLSALSSFQAGEVGAAAVAPQALALEYGYKTRLLGKAGVLALGYQSTAQAADLGLPQSRWLATLGLDWSEHGHLALEYRLDTDYSGASVPGWTLQYHLAI